MAVRLVVVGGGRMGEALVGGLLASGVFAPADIAIVEKAAPRRADLQTLADAGVIVGEDAVACEGAVIAVKPSDVEGACAAVAAAGAQRVLSIAAGIPIVSLERWLGPGIAVVRAMPNTPALVGAGAAAIAAGTTASGGDLDWAERVLGAVGIVRRVPEALLDAVTGLSGSGPAYVFLVAEALIDAGVLAGLPRDISADLAIATLLGAARMLAETGESAEALRAAVTSPGGTTAAGLLVLEQHALRASIAEAVAAATERSRELGGR